MPVDALELLHGELVDGGDVLDAGVVDEDVDVRGQCRMGVEVRQVHHPGSHSLGTEAPDERVQRVAVDVDSVNVGTLCHQAVDDSGSDPAGRTGDERRAAVKHCAHPGSELG